MKNHTSSDYDKAYRICKKIVLSHYENFPVASLLLPVKSRKHIYGIYAFARTADDIADAQNLNSSQKLNMLEEFEEKFESALEGRPGELDEKSAIFCALKNSISELNINPEEFRKLLKAFKQDAVKNRYDEFDELLNYSENSANPVGHLVLNVFGYDFDRDKSVFEFSDKICTALQLTNFWQDVGEDLKIGRIYIPGNLMKKFGYNYEMLENKTESQEFRELIKFLCGKTKSMFDEGRNILNFTKGRLKAELKATIAGGEEILSMIENNNYNVINVKVKLDNFKKLKLILKAFI